MSASRDHQPATTHTTPQSPPVPRILATMDVTLKVPAKTTIPIPGTDVEIHAGANAAEVELTPLQDEVSGRRAVEVTIGDVTLRIPAAD